MESGGHRRRESGTGRTDWTMTSARLVRVGAGLGLPVPFYTGAMILADVTMESNGHNN